MFLVFELLFLFVLHIVLIFFFFFFSSRRRHTRWPRDWSSDVCSSDLVIRMVVAIRAQQRLNAHAEITGSFPWIDAGLHEPGRRSVAERVRRNFSGEPRSEERRVGKECRSRWSPDHERENEKYEECSKS